MKLIKEMIEVLEEEALEEWQRYTQTKHNIKHGVALFDGGRPTF